MEQRVLENPEITNMRKKLVEHPFGTIKHWMDQGYFLTRGFEKVTGEMSLTALCYNIKRVLNIVDVKELMANLQAVKDNFIFILVVVQKIVKKTNNSNFKPIFSIQYEYNHESCSRFHTVYARRTASLLLPRTACMQTDSL